MMKNIQVIDDAINCTYDIFSIEDCFFDEIFPDGIDIEFESDLFIRLGAAKANSLLEKLWAGRCDKKDIFGTFVEI